MSQRLDVVQRAREGFERRIAATMSGESAIELQRRFERRERQLAARSALCRGSANLVDAALVPTMSPAWPSK
jgi:hypothetical protein